MAEIDFEDEGLLEGIEGDVREARLELLRSLADKGVTVEEMREAVAEDRLALLPVERALAGEFKYTPEQVAELSGLDVDFLEREIRALGLPVAGPGEVLLTEEDLEAAKRSKAFNDAGLPEEGIIEVARVIGMSMSRLAEATQSLIGEVYLQAGDTEHDLARRYADMAKLMTPVLGTTMEYVFARHLRESIKQAYISETELTSGELEGSSNIAVSFADMVGFTRLGERIEASEIGELSGRLTEMASSTVNVPVRLVKMIGDAAMLVAPDPGPLLEATLQLVETAAADEEMPPLRAGVALGEAIGRAGDWYGRPVNLASRITGFARPDSVVVDAPTREALGGKESERFSFSFAGKRRFKGIKDEIEVHRARRRAGDDDT